LIPVVISRIKQNKRCIFHFPFFFPKRFPSFKCLIQKNLIWKKSYDKSKIKTRDYSYLKLRCEKI
jgi:hypothetical protein